MIEMGKIIPMPKLRIHLIYKKVMLIECQLPIVLILLIRNTIILMIFIIKRGQVGQLHLLNNHMRNKIRNIK
jgi:hypothetical protein